MSTEHPHPPDRPADGRAAHPSDTDVPEGSGKQFAEDLADVHEVPNPEDPDTGKGFAQGQAVTKPGASPPPDVPDADRDPG